MKPPVIDWRTFVPSGWRSECLVCGCILSEADWKDQRIVAVLDPSGAHACVCEHHIRLGHPDSEEYGKAIRLLAEACARMLARRGG